VPSADSAGFEEFVTARRQALLRTAYLLTGSHADAEDLVQTTLIRVVPRWPRIAERPEAYVRKVMTRECISRWRSRRWREAYVATVPETLAAAQPVDGARVILQRALMQLPPRQRAVIVLRYYEDLTERQTAQQLGIAVGTVKSQARDGLARLRELVPGLDVDEPEDVPAR
jgi:RNA polymerase sigma-70 factor (sigma-E family)